jgi:hypothetical protein
MPGGSFRSRAVIEDVTIVAGRSNHLVKFYFPMTLVTFKLYWLSLTGDMLNLELAFPIGFIFARMSCDLELVLFLMSSASKKSSSVSSPS